MSWVNESHIMAKWIKGQRIESKRLLYYKLTLGIIPEVTFFTGLFFFEVNLKGGKFWILKIPDKVTRRHKYQLVVKNTLRLTTKSIKSKSKKSRQGLRWPWQNSSPAFWKYLQAHEIMVNHELRQKDHYTKQLPQSTYLYLDLYWNKFCVKFLISI